MTTLLTHMVQQSLIDVVLPFGSVTRAGAIASWAWSASVAYGGAGSFDGVAYT